jgi:hypothetical protein
MGTGGETDFACVDRQVHACSMLGLANPCWAPRIPVHAFDSSVSTHESSAQLHGQATCSFLAGWL